MMKNNSASTVTVKGNVVDEHTRCVHYHSPLDVIAIKFKCCGEYYPCFSCHEETSGHGPQVWPKEEWDNKAILCGMCGHELTIHQYMNSGNLCPVCHAGFNPGCKNHYGLYFQVSSTT